MVGNAELMDPERGLDVEDAVEVEELAVALDLVEDAQALPPLFVQPGACPFRSVPVEAWGCDREDDVEE